MSPRLICAAVFLLLVAVIIASVDSAIIKPKSTLHPKAEPVTGKPKRSSYLDRYASFQEPDQYYKYNDKKASSYLDRYYGAGGNDGDTYYSYNARKRVGPDRKRASSYLDRFYGEPERVYYPYQARKRLAAEKAKKASYLDRYYGSQPEEIYYKFHERKRVPFAA